MKATRISKNLLQLTFLGFSNCYLLREKGYFTLIDTSVGGCAEKILQAARDFGGEICNVVLTHAHGDHIGSLDKLDHLLGTVDVGIGQREAPLLHKDLSLRKGEPQQRPKGSFPGATTRLQHTFTEGEMFGSLRCIDTPGHTPGHMSFLDVRDGTLFTGDALVSIGGSLNVVSNPPWYFPLPKVATWDDGLAIASARKLAAYDVRQIATGHGPFLREGSPAIERAVDQATA